MVEIIQLLVGRISLVYYPLRKYTPLRYIKDMPDLFIGKDGSGGIKHRIVGFYSINRNKILALNIT